MCSDAREPKPSARCRQLLCSEGECSVSAQEEARIVKNISKHFQRNKEMQHVEDAAVSLCWHLRRLGWGWPGARSADGLPTSHWFCGNPGMGGAVGRSPASGLKGGPSFQCQPKGLGEPMWQPELPVCTLHTRRSRARWQRCHPGWTLGARRPAVNKRRGESGCWQCRAGSSRVRGPSSGASTCGGDPGCF